MIVAKDIMNESPIVLRPKDSLKRAAERMSSQKAKMALVYEGQEYGGVIMEEDVFSSVFSQGKNPSRVKVEDVAHSDVAKIEERASVLDIERQYHQNPKSRFVVMKSGKVKGIITEMEHTAALRDFTRYHHAIQEVILAVFGILTAFFLFYFSPLGSFLA